MVQQEGAPQARGPEEQKDESINEERVDEVNGQVDDMVADDVGPVEPIVEGEAEETHGPLEGEDIREQAQVPDKGHFADASWIIELERHMKGVGIGNEADEKDQSGMDQGAVASGMVGMTCLGRA
jgi:hypothetical protein